MPIKKALVCAVELPSADNAVAQLASTALGAEGEKKPSVLPP